jgi:lysophospholipase L1-like esterase
MPMIKMKPLIILLGVYILFYSCRRMFPGHMTRIMPDNNNIRYTGRIDFRDPRAPKLAGAGSYLELKFKGNACSVFLKNQNLYDNYNYVSVAIDGNYKDRIKLNKYRTKYKIAENLKDTVHTLLICKATEAQNGYIIFSGILCNEIIPSEKSYSRKIEFIGNSITCGMGLDISEIPCDSGKWFDQHNAYLAYGPLVAREIKADWLLSSVSGIGITRYWNSPGPTMSEVYYKTYLNKDSSFLWDAGKYIPDLVSICLGTNDFSDGDGSYERPELDSAEFVNDYISFIETIRNNYSNAQICCLTSPMLEGEKNIRMQNYLKAVISYMKEVENDEMIHMFCFSQSYINGCSYHPGEEDHKKMAEELIPFFKNVMNWQ